MKTGCAVIVFAKAPVAGEVKSRLAGALGPQGAARLAARMLDDALARAREAAIGEVELCCAPDASHPRFQAAADADTRLSLQGDGDIGVRMRRALEDALRRHPRAILIGTDSPALDAGTLRQAAMALHEHEAVFVPAHDGGYVLVGLARPCPRLFEDIAWSTGEVMRQTRARAAEAGIRICELEAVHDIDDPEDLEHLPKEWLT